MPNQIQIDLTLNDSQFAANIRNANGEVKSFSVAVNGLQTSLKGLESKAATGSISDLTERLRSAKDQLETTDRSGKSYETALKRVAVITKQLGDAQDQAVKSVKSFQVSLSSLNAGPSAGSITDLNQRLYEAKAALESIDPSSKKYELALKRAAVISSQLRTAQENTSSAIANTQKSLGLAATTSDRTSYALINISRIASDSAYGWRGMANNMEPFIQSFISLRKESGSTKGALSALAGGIFSPTGALAAFSILSSAFTMYTMNASKAKTETANIAKETAELKERVRTLKASYDDLAKAMQSNRKELLKTSIAQIEEQNRTLQSLINKGGEIVDGEFIQYPKDVMDKLRNDITKNKDSLKDLYNEAASGGKEIQANISLLKDLSEAAKNGGKNAVDSLVNNKKLSEGQLSTLISQLKDYRENVTSIKGGIAPNIDKGWKEIAMQLQLSRNDVTETITVLEEYQKSLNKEPEPNGLIPKLRKQVEELKKTLDNSTSKPIMRAIESKITQLERYINYLENLDKQGISGKDIPDIEFSFSTESQEKMFKELKESFARQGMPWDATHKAFAAALVLKAEPETAAANTKKAPASMKPVKVNNNGGIKDAAQLTDKELDNLQFKADLLKGVFTEVGDALVDGMFEGKMAAEELIKTIGKLIIKMLLMKAIEATVNAILPGAGSVLGAIFHEGGVADSPKSVRRVSANVFSGAKKYHTGLMPNEMPAIITKDEMVLTRGQQSNLFAMLNRSLSKTSGLEKQKIAIELTGGLVAKGDDFYLNVHKGTNKILKRLRV